MKKMCRGQFQDPQAGLHATFALQPAKKWKFPIIVILICCWCCFSATMYAQGAIKYSVTYVTETKTTYQTNDSLHTFPIFEQLQLIPVITRDSIIKLVYTNNDIKTTVFHLQNSSYPEWATRPAKTIIDKTRIKIFDAGGNMILNQVHAAKYKSKNNQLKSLLTTNNTDILPNYIYLSPTMKTDFTARGFAMTNLGEGTFRFVKDSVTLYYNNSRRINEMQMANEDGTIRYGIKRAFRTNARGVVVPSFEIITKQDKRFGDHCVNEVAITDYVYYDYVTYAGGKWDEDAENDGELIEISIQPNPATNNIVITVPFANIQQPLKIYDNTGNLVFETIIEKHMTEINIDISNLQSGMYYAQLFYPEALITKSFIKN